MAKKEAEDMWIEIDGSVNIVVKTGKKEERISIPADVLGNLVIDTLLRAVSRDAKKKEPAKKK